MNTYLHLWPYLASFILELEMSHTKVVEKVKTHILRSMPPLPPENRAVYEPIDSFI